MLISGSMYHRRLTLLLLLLWAAPVAAQRPGWNGTTFRRQLAGDTVPTSRTLRLGLALVPSQPALTLPEQLRGPLLPPPEPFEDFVQTWVAATRDRLARRESTLLRDLSFRRNGMAETLVADTVAYLPPPPVQRDTARNLLGGVVGQYADLGMKVSGRGELGGSWTRYQPCDPSLYLNCKPSLFPQLRPDVQFGVQVGGTISNRVHVDVDYDQTREFDAANNIHVFYQGLPDEVVQRVEVGDVSFSLPSSRFLTQGIPAGNFGFMASGQVGPMDFQTVFAQQKGDLSTKHFRLAGGGAAQNENLVQDAQVVLDDADYAKGQFFFLMDPDSLTGAPHVDVLALQAGDAPASLRPAPGGTIQLYRDERIAASAGQQQGQVGYFLADAISAGPDPVKHSGLFRRLVPGQDYIVHSSGLWIVLRAPLRDDEALAVSYVTEAGDTIGTVDAEQSPPGVKPILRLLRGSTTIHQPGSPTWKYEMHQVYRLDASSGVDMSTVDLHISLGDLAGGKTFTDVSGRQVTYLKLFGMDEESPADRLDAAQIYQPGQTGFASDQGPQVSGTFIVFPTLQPFLTPPPVPSEGLTAADAAAALGSDANETIYENPDPVARDDGARFRLNFTYRVNVQGLVSSFDLGAFGIREGSEQLKIGDKKLTRDVDYTIDYDIGKVTLTDPQNLFATNPGAELTAQWEQKALFQVAPTSVFGINTSYHLGSRGTLNFVGLYQNEKSIMSRPQLGVEPGAIFLGGSSADVTLGGGLLDRALNSIPGLRLGTPSTVHLTSEVAVSMPNPNTRGDAYVDDFEGTDEVPLDVRRQNWRLGSRPQTNQGDEGTLPLTPDVSNAAPIVWQHDYVQDGVAQGTLFPRQIDQHINVAGNEVPEAVMWLTFGNQQMTERMRRWRSITTVLSPTGRDMSRSEYLEFYVAAGTADPLALIFDIGTVGEDAFYVDSLGETTGTYPDGQPWGLGVLDEEAVAAQREVWGKDKDLRGLWNQPCQVEPLTPYPIGDPRSNCTRGNGFADTEDLDGNGILDPDDGAYFRYVVQLDQASPYLVRDTSATGTGYRLYRIPLRAAGTAVNGASDGTWRFIKDLRLTVAGETQGVRLLSLARIRIVGSRWTKRSVSGILRGMAEGDPGMGDGTTQFRVGPVSQLTDGSVYAQPPGVLNQLQDPSAQFGTTGVEFNEKSLRLGYDGLQPGDRGEVYFRYPQQPRNFLIYRQLRLWALAKQGNWGPQGDETLLIKVGTDPDNFYLYRTRLKAPVGDRNAVPNDWLPEVVIDFQPWFELKALAEQELIQQGTSAAQDTLWSADSAYAIVLQDRARAPNLASIREISFAVYNGGSAPVSGEVWIDDMRLSGATRDPGYAGTATLDITGDFLSGSVQYSHRGALFRQLNQDPTYLGSGDLTVNASARLDHFFPESWGLDIPVSVSRVTSAQRPDFLESSDVLANRLAGLRSTGSGMTRVGMRISKHTPSSNRWVNLLVDGTSLRFGYTKTNNNSITATNEAGGVDAGLDYTHSLAPHTVAAVPGFLAAGLRALLPHAIEESEAFQKLVGSRFRWNPARIIFGTGYSNQNSKSYRYDRILTFSGDTAVVPIESPRQSLQNNASVEFRFFEPLSASLGVRSTRDLLDPERAAAGERERQALAAARGSLLGQDLGWEVNRSMTASLTYRPEVTPWLRPGFSFSNRFGTDRSPSYISLLVAGSDTTAELQRRFSSERQVSRTLVIQPASALTGRRELPGDTTHHAPATGFARAVRAIVGRVQTIDLTWNSGLRSQFERENLGPGFSYQLGLGNLTSFQQIGADTAVSVLARNEYRARTSIQLPLSAQLDLTYRDASSQGFDQRGGKREQRDRNYPGLSLSFRQLPIPESLRPVVPAASVSGGFDHTIQHSLYGGTAQERGAQETRIPMSLSLTFGVGITASYNGTLRNGTSTDPTGNAENHAVNHSLTVTGTLQPPGFMKQKIKRPVQMALSMSLDAQRQCRFQLGGTVLEGSAGVCVPYVDASTRNLTLTLDTMLSDIDVGVQMSYTSRRSHVGTQTGSNQFQLGVFGQFNFSAGDLPGLGQLQGIPR